MGPGRAGHPGREHLLGGLQPHRAGARTAASGRSRRCGMGMAALDLSPLILLRRDPHHLLTARASRRPVAAGGYDRPHGRDTAAAARRRVPRGEAGRVQHPGRRRLPRAPGGRPRAPGRVGARTPGSASRRPRRAPPRPSVEPCRPSSARPRRLTPTRPSSARWCWPSAPPTPRSARPRSRQSKTLEQRPGPGRPPARRRPGVLRPRSSGRRGRCPSRPAGGRGTWCRPRSRELEAARDQLHDDVDVLERHLEEQRDRLRHTVRELQMLLDDPAALRQIEVPVGQRRSRPRARVTAGATGRGGRRR